jgi:acetyl-CoA carboxylase carboxyltransferase component
MTKPPDWQETLDDLEHRRRRTLAMGGPERLAKHHGKGKLAIRGRFAKSAPWSAARPPPTASSSGPA